jgi:hypothetical protein
MNELLSEIERLNAENARLRATLEAVEWVVVEGAGFKACPWCEMTVEQGHRADCARQIALGIAPEGTCNASQSA